MASLFLAQNTLADKFLEKDPLGLLIGMLLDQQIPIERAFSAPYELAQRLGVKHLDAGEMAAYDREAFAALFSERPALHRFPAAMAERSQKLAQLVVDEYEGDARRLWSTAKDGRELVKRLKALPGFGAKKAQIFAALLGKRLNVRPAGWREAAGDFGREGVVLSVADIVDSATLEKLRAYKQSLKAAKRSDG